LQGSPPPQPHACKPEPMAEVRAADEGAAPWFRDHPGEHDRTAKEVFDAGHIVRDLAEVAADVERARDDQARELRDLADQLHDEERTPALDQREQDQRSRGKRQR
jgi:hypothetical protein